MTYRIPGIADKREQGQRPAHPHHDDDDEEQHKAVVEDCQHAGGEHLVQCVYVRGDPRHESAYGVAVEEGRSHALEMAENLRAHVEHDLLPGPLHQVGLQQFQQEGEQQCGQIEPGKLRHASHREALRCRESQDRARVLRGCAAGHIGVDRNLDEEGTGDVASLP